MNNTTIREPNSFGKRQKEHSISITRNGKTRQFNVNPAIFTSLACVVVVFMVGYLSATAYLVFRDDLLGATRANYARTVNEYEDRIAALRSRLDRITSRQLLDQQAIEAKVAALIDRQTALGERNGKFGKMLERVKKSGIRAGLKPVPQVNPRKHAGLDKSITATIVPSGTIATASLGLSKLPSPKSSAGPLVGKKTQMTSKFTESLFGQIAQQLSGIDAAQHDELESLRASAISQSKKIAKELTKLGVSAPRAKHSAVGGPFIPAQGDNQFGKQVEALDQSLNYLDAVRKKAKTLPIFTPAPGQKISSRFGTRKDPFNGRLARHSGLDFKGASGTPVRASGAGKVIKAGRNGGYGNMVEIKHSDDLTTRYAHLSRIKVKVGQKIRAGSIVGLIGSTGRSTGPHLHFEVRRSGKAINPMTMLRAGKRIHPLL